MFSAIRSGAVEIDGHLQIDGLDRWLVVEGGSWVLVDVEVPKAVRIDGWTLVTLRACEPVRGSRLVELPRRGRFCLRPVFCRGGDGVVGLHVGLCAAP